MLVIGIAGGSGCGKTTTAINLAAALKKNDFNVLLIDTDSNPGLTQVLLQPGEVAEVTLTDIYEKLMEARVDGTPLPDANMGKKISAEGLEYIPCDVNLGSLEYMLNRLDIQDPATLLKSFIEQQTEYDYIIIDSPGDFDQRTINALVASDEFIIPIVPEPMCIKAVTELLPNIDMVMAQNPDLTLSGILLTNAQMRTNLTKRAIEEIRDSGLPVFENIIPRATAVAGAPVQGKSVLATDPRNAAAVAYDNFCNEYLQLERERY